MKKKIALACTAVVLVAAVVVGTTLAWFTDTEAKTNVVTMGNVNIDLTEPSYVENATVDSEGNLHYNDYAMPGDKIAKDPTITNTGDFACYVRAKIEFTSSAEGAALSDADLYFKYTDPDTQAVSYISINDASANGNKWVKSGEYWYYTEPLKKNDAVVLFDTVIVPEEWNNEVANQDFSISVSAEAIQADNFQPKEVNGVYGWYNSNGDEVTVENYDD